MLVKVCQGNEDGDIRNVNTQVRYLTGATASADHAPGYSGEVTVRGYLILALSNFARHQIDGLPLPAFIHTKLRKASINRNYPVLGASLQYGQEDEVERRRKSPNAGPTKSFECILSCHVIPANFASKQIHSRGSLIGIENDIVSRFSRNLNALEIGFGPEKVCPDRPA
jgi:hypothetical protein